MLNERVLVTGGSGFIGTNLIATLLDLGAAVRNLDISPPLNKAHRVAWISGDCTSSADVTSAIRETGATSVVHLAARTDLDESATLEDYATNFVGVEVVLDATRRSATVQRVLVASTMLVHELGDDPEHLRVYRPQNTYGESKVLAEKLVRESSLDQGWTIVRPTTIWGPWNIRVNNEFLRRVANGTYLHPSGRSAVRTYGYVGNAVFQLLQLLACESDSVAGKTLYISDPPFRLDDYVDAFSVALRGRPARRVPLKVLRMAALLGDWGRRVGFRSVPLTTYRLAYMTRDNVIDIADTLELTGPGPYGLKQAVAATVRWSRGWNPPAKLDQVAG